MLKKVMLIFVVFLITSCSGIPPSSVYKMMTANPLEFHPDTISVAIKRSNTIQINTGDVKMSLKIHSDDPALKVKEDYFFTVDNNPQVPSLAKDIKSHQALTVLTLAPNDVMRMQNLQKTMKKHLKNGGNKDDFGFSVSVLEGCKNTHNIPSDVYVSLYLKLDSQSNFFPLYRDFNIGQADLSPLKSVKDWDNCKN